MASEFSKQLDSFQPVHLLGDIALRTCASLGIGLGLVVMMGWWLRLPQVVQILPTFVPMQFNTALSFLLAGSGLWAAILLRPRWVKLIAAVLALLCGSTLAQYLFDLNLGIDQLFVHAWTQVLSPFPGRMSPLTAIGFCVLSLALMLGQSAGRAALHISMAAAAVVATISLSAIIGYAQDAEPLFDWPAVTSIAVHTAAGLAIMAMGITLQIRRQVFRRADVMRHPIWIEIGLVGLMTAGLLFWRDNAEKSQSFRQLLVAERAIGLSQRLTDRLEQPLGPLNRMAAWLDTHPDELDSWTTGAERLLSDLPALTSIAIRNDSTGQQHAVGPAASIALLHDKVAELNDQLTRVADTSQVRALSLVRDAADTPYFLLYRRLNPRNGEPQQLFALADVRQLLDIDLKSLSNTVNAELRWDGQSLLARDTAPVAHHAFRSDLDFSAAGLQFRLQVSDAALTAPLGTQLIVLLVISTFAYLLYLVSVLLLDSRARSAQLAKSRAHLNAVLNSTAEAVLGLDHAARVHTRNRMAEALLPFSASEPRPLLIDLLRPLTDQVSAPESAELVLALDTKRLRLNSLQQDGAKRVVEVSVRPIEDAAELAWVVSMRDITDHTELERMKREFISTVSHELRTPLTSINGSLELLASGVLDDNQEQRNQLQKVAIQNVGRLRHLVDDLLDIEKLATQGMRFELSLLQLQALAEEAIRANLPFASSLEVSIKAELPAQPLWVKVDHLRFQQALSNLISNACKYSPNGSAVKVSVQALDHRARLAVTDSGPGIPTEFRDRIFGRFAQADSSDTRMRGGTGLGLAITRELVERMGGSVGFESCLGKGSEFWIELPLHIADGSLQPQVATGGAEQTAPSKT